MSKKDDELLSIQYQIEKAGVRQQKLEEGYESVTAALKRSKRNNRIMLALFLGILLLAFGFMGMYMGKFNSMLQFGDDDEKSALINEVDDMQTINDSLQIELAKLKSEISAYKLNTKSVVSEENTTAINPLETITPTLDEGLRSKNKSSQNKKTTTASSTKSSKPKKYQKQYCYPVKAFKRGEIGFIEVDYIQFFQGRRAVQEARKLKKAEYDFNAKGDTLFFLETNHFIHNQSSKLRILELDDNVKVKGVNQVNKGFSMKALQSIVARKPILILELKDGIVYRISEKKI